VPAAGKFGDVSIANASTIDPENGIGTQVYHANNGFEGTWIAYAGGAYASGLGTLGSMLFFSGGNGAYDGNGVVRYDIATRTFSMHTQPDNTGVYRTSTGATSSNSTHSLDSDAVNDRVGLAGHYIKDGFGNAYAGTESTGNSTTVWKPFPLHSLCGITYLPADAGGGTLGSLIVVGHDMNGIRVLSANGRIFRLDLATNVWSAIPFPFYQFQIMVAAEYDSIRKLLWTHPAGSNRPFVWSYLTGTGGTIAGPTINATADYANYCHMPNRDLLLYVTQTGGTSLAVRAINLASYSHASYASQSLPSYTLNIAQTFPTGWPTTLQWPGVFGSKDKLDYCEYDGCVYYLERATAGQTTCTLWKLTPPAVGQEQSGTWSWSNETIQMAVGTTSYACNGTGKEPSWGGRARYIHAVKSIIMSDGSTLPVQAIRSANWV
jgi:hypothetical protein